MKRLHTALINGMEKEADQVQFFKELRVLNPRRLSVTFRILWQITHR